MGNWSLTRKKCHCTRCQRECQPFEDSHGLCMICYQKDSEYLSNLYAEGKTSFRHSPKETITDKIEKFLVEGKKEAKFDCAQAMLIACRKQFGMTLHKHEIYRIIKKINKNKKYG
jgi:hypothetical protein